MGFKGLLYKGVNMLNKTIRIYQQAAIVILTICSFFICHYLSQINKGINGIIELNKTENVNMLTEVLELTKE